MAKKDFDEYFLQQQKAYYTAINAIEEYGKMFADKMISQEQLNQAKMVLSPTIETYRMLTTIKSLLDRPNRSKKAKKYDKNIKENQYSKNNIAKQNTELLNQFKEEYLHDERNTDR